MNKNPFSDYLNNLTEYERKYAPDSLYWVGDFNLLLNGLRVSVVGSRKPTEEGKIRARVLCQELIKHDITIASGLAEGIDTIAHETTIKNKGKTISVLGTPLDITYPKKNIELLNKIKSEHLAVTQFPYGYPFQKRNFPMRNRTMALISDATVIVEASENSGTRHQGWEALRLGRILFIMNNVVNDSNISWANEMIKYGAQVLHREDLEHFPDLIPNLTSNLDYAF